MGVGGGDSENEGAGPRPPFAPAVAEVLWAHADALAERGAQELSPVHVRRALVTLAVAGSGGDLAAFRAVAARVRNAARRAALDPVPLFDAAAALVDEDDAPAREALIRLPREPVAGPRPR